MLAVTCNFPFCLLSDFWMLQASRPAQSYHLLQGTLVSGSSQWDSTNLHDTTNTTSEHQREETVHLCQAPLLLHSPLVSGPKQGPPLRSACLVRCPLLACGPSQRVCCTLLAAAAAARSTTPLLTMPRPAAASVCWQHVHRGFCLACSERLQVGGLGLLSFGSGFRVFT